MDILIRRFKKDISPLVKKSGINTLLLNPQFFSVEIEEISSATEKIFSNEELMQINSYFEKYAESREDRAIWDLTLFFANFVFFFSFKLMTELSNVFTMAILACGLLMWLGYVKLNRHRDYLNIASLNVVRHALGMSLLGWNQYTDMYRKTKQNSQ